MSDQPINVNVDSGAIASAVMQTLEDQVNNLVEAAVKRLEDRANAGWVTPDGGTKDKNIKSFGDFLVAVSRGDERRLTEHYKSVKALNEQDGSEGGYLVPPEFERNMLTVSTEVNPIDGLGGIGPMGIPMTGRTLSIPKLDYSTTPTTGNSAMDAGVVTYWSAEAATVLETEPKFKNMQLNANVLTGYTAASNELLADSAVALEALLVRLFGQAIGRRRLYAFLRGNGVGQPLGVINAPALRTVTRGTGAANVESGDIAGMMSRMMPGSFNRAVWMAHPYQIAELLPLTFGSNTAFTWGDIRAGIPTQFAGRPIYFVEYMSAPGTAFDLALIDWTYYVVGQRQQTTIAYSPHVRFLNRQKVWLFEHRVDGQPWIDSTITLSDGVGTNTVSPFVSLS